MDTLLAIGRRRFVILGSVAVFTLTMTADLPGAPTPSPVQAETKTVWQGVYSKEQAERGRRQFVENCATCHGEDLAGGSAVALTGPRFIESWNEDSLGSLFGSISRTMPRGRPGTLAEGAYADIVAFILQKNDFPPGVDELQATTISSIRVEGRNGPGPVPNFSLVTVVGCLTQPSARQWRLVAASEPTRTRNPKASPEAERAALKATPPGTHTYDLLDVYRSTELHGMPQVEVKGFLIRMPNQDRLNVTSIETLDANCGK